MKKIVKHLYSTKSDKGLLQYTQITMFPFQNIIILKFLIQTYKYQLTWSKTHTILLKYVPCVRKLFIIHKNVFTMIFFNNFLHMYNFRNKCFEVLRC